MKAFHLTTAAFLAYLATSTVPTDDVGRLLAQERRAGFEDVTEAVGLRYRIVDAGGTTQSGQFGNVVDGGGLALADIDKDGRVELYVAHGHGETGRLFSWDGERFSRIPDNAGIAPAAIDRSGYFIDLDEDGRLDFLSLHSQGMQAFHNDGKGQFTATASPFGAKAGGTARSMSAADHDGDGDLDLLFSHWGRRWNPIRLATRYLWRNDGKGRYEDVSHTVPVRRSRLPGTAIWREFSYTPTFVDIDTDGDPDILVAADFGASQVLRNDGTAGFTDITGPAITDENAMGAAAGDYDGDGNIDWFVTSIYDPDGLSGVRATGNRLYRNSGDGRFGDVTDSAAVRDGGWGWGACLEDFDNDGHRDLFHTIGWLQEPGVEETTAQFVDDRSRLFMANGDGTFAERSSELGIEHTGQGRGVVCADYDGDGRVDIFIANHGAAPTLYRNVSRTGHSWLALDLLGQHANPQGIGARVTVRTASGQQVREVRLGGSYLSQAPPTLHFGLGANRAVRSIEVRWPGPGGQVSRLEDVAANRRIAIRQPAPEGFLLSVVGGTGTGIYAGGAAVPVAAEGPRAHYRFSHWSSEGGGAFADRYSRATSFTMPGGGARAFAHFLPGPPSTVRRVSVARRWIEVLLQAIRDDLARPTVHARNLFHLSAAMYDAWAAQSDTARPWAFGDADLPCEVPDFPAEVGAPTGQEEAISHAAWRLIRHRFRRSPGAAVTARNADILMAALGYRAADAGSAPAKLGRCIAEFYIARGLADGSNEANDYANVAYRPANSALDPSDSGNPDLTDPNRWQPLWLDWFIDQSGHRQGQQPEFLSAEWGWVHPFALSAADRTVHERDGVLYPVYHDPGPPPALDGPQSDQYKWGFALVGRWSSQLSPEEEALIDIAPSGLGNVAQLPKRFEDYPRFYRTGAHGPGHRRNPATGRAYRPQLVPLGDYARVLAEFWADGPDSETPPGHWYVILNAVNDDERLDRRLGGRGPLLGPLEWDLKSYLALGGAMHDAAIAAWSVKGRYDYIRPISALRTMADRGQSSEPGLPSWSADGIQLAEGFVELVGADDPLAGPKGEHAGKVKIRAWRGPGFIGDPAADMAGVAWILARNWWPYQQPSFVTPPFAGYVSGHSTFSRAAAEVLTELTGDAFFPGGMFEVEAPAQVFLRFERGPSRDIVLQWATYRDAADQCSLSRIWGGIHPPADDIPGRIIGARVGRDAFYRAVSLFRGDAALDSLLLWSFPIGED